jgi:hypothetical protein
MFLMLVCRKELSRASAIQRLQVKKKMSVKIDACSLGIRSATRRLSRVPTHAIKGDFVFLEESDLLMSRALPLMCRVFLDDSASLNSTQNAQKTSDFHKNFCPLK